MTGAWGLILAESQLRLEQPEWLWILILVVPTVLIGLRTFAAMSPLRRGVAIAVRVGLIGLAAALLAGLASATRTRELAVVALVDVSGSVERFVPAGERVEDARSLLATAAKKRGADDLLGIVVFDGRPAAVASPTRADPTGRELPAGLAEGTNIAEAIRLGSAMIPPEATGRLLLVSDGVQTAGDALAAADAGSGGARVPIDVLPQTFRLEREVAIEALDAPPSAAAGAPVTLRVALTATAPSRGVLRVLEGDEPIPGAAREIELVPGARVERFEVPASARRVHRFTAVYEPDPDESPSRLSGDTYTQNNRAEAFTVSPGKGAVLVVSGKGGGALAGVLRSAGAEVSVAAPEGMPAGLLALQAYDLIVLDDVPADRFAAEAPAQLAGFVTELGGGLVMTGGRDSFVSGGWRGSALEPVLPVSLDLSDVLMTPQAATVFVLDNSGSMRRDVLGTGKTQQDIANDAAALALRSLDGSDLVGVIVFNSEYEVLVPLGANRESGKTGELVREIEAGGGTNASPALEEAMRQLRQVPEEIKHRHIVFLTDGVSQLRERLGPLAQQMGREGVRLTAVAVGDEADTLTMSRMADLSGGVYFHATQATQLPRLLLKAVRVVRTPAVRERPFTPIIEATGSSLTARLESPLPELGGLSVTKFRREPTVINAMRSPDGEPVLAHWAAGLGQAAAWTSDTDEWASDWANSPAFATLWTNVLRSISRPPGSPGLSPEVETRADGVRLRLRASDDAGRPREGLTVDATLYSPRGDARRVELRQTGPGLYEGDSPAGGTGSYIAVIRPRAGERPLPALVAGTTLLEGAEFRARASDEALLTKIAQRSGGRVLSWDRAKAGDVFDRTAVVPRETVMPLWRSLLAWLVVGVLVDVGVRRIAWDRWISRRFGAAPAGVEPAPAAAASLGRLRERLGEGAAEGPAIALSEADAARLAQAARDRRREQRLAGMRSDHAAEVSFGEAGQSESGNSPPARAEAGQSPLLAAKRRAENKFREDRGEG